MWCDSRGGRGRKGCVVEVVTTSTTTMIMMMMQRGAPGCGGRGRAGREWRGAVGVRRRRRSFAKGRMWQGLFVRRVNSTALSLESCWSQLLFVALSFLCFALSCVAGAVCWFWPRLARSAGGGALLVYFICGAPPPRARVCIRAGRGRRSHFISLFGRMPLLCLDDLGRVAGATSSMFSLLFVPRHGHLHVLSRGPILLAVRLERVAAAFCDSFCGVGGFRLDPVCLVLVLVHLSCSRACL